jgi:hypothetical protein
MRTHTTRDKVWLQIVGMEPDEEFQVHHIQELIEYEFDELVSEQTIRGVIKTLREDDLVKHTQGGKWFVRNF